MRQLLIEYFRKIFWETKTNSATFDAEKLADEFFNELIGGKTNE